MPAPGRAINLVPPTEFELSFWGRFLKWAVTAGRYIIILTELVVIVVFLSRFKLDRDLSLVNDEIEGAVSVLEAESSVEERFLSAQKRLMIVDKIITNQLGAGGLLERLTNKFPAEVKINSLTLDHSEVNIQAVAVSEKSMGDLLLTLNQDPKWKSLEVVDVSAETASGIKFLLRIKY